MAQSQGPPPRLDELAAKADKAPAPWAQLYRELSRPFDALSLASGTVNVVPLADFPGKPPNFDGTWNIPLIAKPAEVASFTREELLSVVFFESTALATINAFLDAKAEASKDLAERVRLQSAEHLLRAVLVFHQGTRRRIPLTTDPWRELKEPLEKRLLEVRRALLADFAKEAESKKRWDDTIALANAWGLNDVARECWIRFADERLAAGDFSAVRKILDRLEEDVLPSPLTEPIRKALQKRAETLFREAKDGGAQANLDEALKLWPRLTGARDELARRTNTYKVLYVAVPELPEMLSPATAWTDTEKQALELLFEGLVRIRHEETVGQTYEPLLAREVPLPRGLGRRFALARDASWSDGERLTAVDVRHTLQLLASDEMAGRDRSWRDLLEPPRFEGNPFELNLKLRQGIADPLTLFHFKILPQQYRGKELARADDPEFAKSPLGSGPFVYSGRRVEDGRTYAIFQANPAFVRRNRPWHSNIREIRFFAWSDASKDIGTPLPHVVLGISSDQAAALNKFAYADIRRPLPRRVYILAVNNRLPALANLNLRRALALGFQREAILEEAFRGPDKVKADAKLYLAVNGPFPAKSWACCPSPRVPADLHQPELARSLAKKAAADLGAVRLTLKYPAHTPGAKEACEAMERQLAKLFADASAKIELQLVPVSERQMQEALSKREFDLAYHHIDFPDDNFWLWPMFDPSDGALHPGGANYLGYVNDAKLQSLFSSATNTREFTTLRDLQHSIHAHLVERMPLIPLWQLHAAIAIHPSFVPVGLDPLLVFPNVLEWKL
ncbi:MAG: ABC transporter substrate-binding protein [Planctomycetes bacterium]|nr:ABC transporter substrate-binding protein [Planctomycetota bacterium]